MFHKKDEILLTKEQENTANESLLKGVAERSATLFLVFGIGSLLYGFQTISFLRLFDTNITLLSNVWPRILLSSAPCFVIYFLQKKISQSTNLKILLWAIGFPIIYLINCMIYVWPIIYSGQTQAYLYFHAANMFCITLSFIMVAPNLKYFAIHFFSLVLTFFVPLLYLLKNDSSILSLFLNDSLSSLAISYICATFLYSLRKKLLCYDIKFKDAIKPFLGNSLVNAISTETLDKLSKHKANGIILSMDLRGFTNFIKSYDKEITSAFMKDYHNLITDSFLKQGGHLHKSNGDGHILSFGVMDIADLSDIASIQTEVEEADERRIATYLEKIDHAFPLFINGFHQLLNKYNLPNILKIGAGLDIGQIRLILHGDLNTKMELDIEGEVIIRSTRLEAYSKVLNKNVHDGSSFLTLTNEAFAYLQKNTYTQWITSDSDLKIRDYPNIENVYYKAWLLPLQAPHKSSRAA